MVTVDILSSDQQSRNVTNENNFFKTSIKKTDHCEHTEDIKRDKKLY